MAGKKGKNGKRRRQKIPIFATAGVLIGLKNLWDAYKEGGTGRAFIALTGYDSNYGFNWKWATAGIPMVAGPLASMAVSKIGLNRHINIPMFKL